MAEKIECDEIAHERELRQSWELAHEKIHALEDVARDIASTEINRRLDEMNQLRHQIEQERGTYISRPVYDSENKATDARLKILENANSNLAGRMWVFIAVLALINLAVWFFGHK